MSKNIVLKVKYLEPEVECVDLEEENYKMPEIGYLREDEYFFNEFSPIFYVICKMVKNTLVAYTTEAGIDDDTFKLLEKGLDQKLTGRYDIPEWKLSDLTAGEVLIFAWQKANSTRAGGEWFNKKYQPYIKYLTRGNYKFPEVPNPLKGTKP